MCDLAREATREITQCLRRPETPKFRDLGKIQIDVSGCPDEIELHGCCKVECRWDVLQFGDRGGKETAQCRLKQNHPSAS